ncbi:MAG: hypothetical protein U9N00_04985, partial [Candidatus Bipolaricaulota bacterium]|nr:hypothetical protein [Candidatus Bipolaricaulota bacterium]
SSTPGKVRGREISFFVTFSCHLLFPAPSAVKASAAYGEVSTRTTGINPVATEKGADQRMDNGFSVAA